MLAAPSSKNKCLFYCVSILVGCVRQERDIASAFDCLGQHSLMYGAVARYSPRENLAAFRNKVSEKPGIFEINDIYFFNAETANAAAAHAASTATLRGTATIEIVIVIVVAPSAVFVICRHSYLLTVNRES
jgi:hypothetical protein